MTLSPSAGVDPAAFGVERAIDVFVRGFCFTRSFTHPCVATRVGPLWLMRDAPRTGGDDRTDEWVAHGVDPAEAHRTAAAHARGRRYAICAVRGPGEPVEPLRAGFKSLGYRLLTTEPLMAHSLKRVPRFEAPVTVERVTTRAVADRLAKAARARQILPEHLVDGAPLRQYVALADDGRLVGWVRSISAGEGTWCSNMHVEPAWRRRGIARAMLARMLRDDRAAGARAAVLLASRTGALLYPVVGYEPIGTLLLFTPPKRADALRPRRRRR
jgi:GNAT superfamily N-acetyltransferase